MRAGSCWAASAWRVSNGDAVIMLTLTRLVVKILVVKILVAKILVAKILAVTMFAVKNASVVLVTNVLLGLALQPRLLVGRSRIYDQYGKPRLVARRLVGGYRHRNRQTWLSAFACCQRSRP